MAYLSSGRESTQCESAQSRASRWLHRLREQCGRIVDAVPSDCLLCQGRASGGRLCAGCAADVVGSMHNNAPRCAVCSIVLAPGPGCPDCARREPAFERIISAFDYQPPGDLLVRRFKGGAFAYARALSGLLACATRAAEVLPAGTILVPVPASRASIKMRGFNPAAEIARYLARQLQLECRPGLLLRVREGVKQTRLSREERFLGTEGLYHCPRRVDGAAIAVVDDVLTTGSTLNSIARRFKDAGAGPVYGLVVARTPFHERPE